MNWLEQFVAESNGINGVDGFSQNDLDAHKAILSKRKMKVQHLVDFVSTVQPGAVLRDYPDAPRARIGIHTMPPGGPSITSDLKQILKRTGGVSSRITYCRYQALYPFTSCNERSGRALWLWNMKRTGLLICVKEYGFLHYFHRLMISDFREFEK